MKENENTKDLTSETSIPAIKGSAVRNVSKSKTGKPWLNLPIEENKSKANTSPPARRATRLKKHRTKEQ